MTTAPNWLVYTSAGIALAALLVSLMSMAISLATYRRAGPNVRVHYRVSIAERGYFDPDTPARVEVKATNRGLADVEVIGFRLSHSDRKGKHFRWSISVSNRRLKLDHGSPLPFRLEAGTTRSWHCAIQEIDLGVKTTSDPSNLRRELLRARLFVQLGNGRIARFRPPLTAYLEYLYLWYKYSRESDRNRGQ